MQIGFADFPLAIRIRKFEHLGFPNHIYIRKIHISVDNKDEDADFLQIADHVWIFAHPSCLGQRLRKKVPNFAFLTEGPFCNCLLTLET